MLKNGYNLFIMIYIGLDQCEEHFQWQLHKDAYSNLDYEWSEEHCYFLKKLFIYRKLLYKFFYIKFAPTMNNYNFLNGIHKKSRWRRICSIFPSFLSKAETIRKRRKNGEVNQILLPNN